jgi:uncharacterized membrane protein YphA (DoxX/SURF4 family)
MQVIVMNEATMAPEFEVEPEPRTHGPIEFHVMGDPARWNRTTRIGFRFVFAYFAFYWISLLSAPVWKYMVSWAAVHILHQEHAPKFVMNGSGDTAYEYVMAFCFLVLSVVVTGIWSALDSRRANYEKFYQWLRLTLRIGLGAFLILYGSVKVIQAQMPVPALSTLTETYGESSPMHLLWTFMGASRGYNAFAGGAEMLSGLLLFVPGLTTLGALVTMGVMSNVFVLNMCYDVPVKLFSFHLLLMAIVLAAPDLHALAGLFLFGRRVELRQSPPLFRRRWLNRSVLGLQLAFCLLVTAGGLYAAHEGSTFENKTVGAPLYGVWSVQEYAVDGKVVPPLPVTEARWQRVIFDNTWRLTVEPGDGARQHFRLQMDEKKQGFTLSKIDDEKWKADFTYQNPLPNVVLLSGHMDGHQINVRMRQVDTAKMFPLTSRGFHWVNEYPFNR